MIGANARGRRTQITEGSKSAMPESKLVKDYVSEEGHAFAGCMDGDGKPYLDNQRMGRSYVPTDSSMDEYANTYGEMLDRYLAAWRIERWDIVNEIKSLL